MSRQAPPCPPEYITHSLNKKRLDYRNNLRTKTIIETKLEKNVGTYFIDAKKNLEPNRLLEQNDTFSRRNLGTKS